MLGFQTDNEGRVTAVAGPDDHDAWKAVNRWASFEEAEDIAAQATELTGDLHLACDRSRYVSPRYVVVRAPKVGDKVSYAFNGDYYPDGVIRHVTKTTCRVVKTDTGRTYYRRKLGAGWKMQGGTWSLVPGHISRYNREF